MNDPRDGSTLPITKTIEVEFRFSRHPFGFPVFEGLYMGDQRISLDNIPGQTIGAAMTEAYKEFTRIEHEAEAQAAAESAAQGDTDVR